MSIKVYEVINNRNLKLLEQGSVPWRKTWNAGSSMPVNICSKKNYRGVNVFLLACMPYSSPYWMTFKQCADKGGNIIKGSKSTPVIFWKWLDRNDADATDTDTGKIPMLRFYNVFNLEQTEGIEPPQTTETINTFTRIERAEQIIAGMPYKPEIRHGGNRASYSPILDYIKLPEPTTFQLPEEYYSTAFHELSHATGHVNRLARKSILEPSYFGGHEYSKEELVAEMGSAFLCGHAGIENTIIENSAAYIQGWLKALKNDKALLIHAAAQAQKAADYILNVKTDQQGEIN